MLTLAMHSASRKLSRKLESRADGIANPMKVNPATMPRPQPALRRRPRSKPSWKRKIKTHPDLYDRLLAVA